MRKECQIALRKRVGAQRGNVGRCKRDVFGPTAILDDALHRSIIDLTSVVLDEWMRSFVDAVKP